MKYKPKNSYNQTTLSEQHHKTNQKYEQVPVKNYQELNKEFVFSLSKSELKTFNQRAAFNAPSVSKVFPLQNTNITINVEIIRQGVQTFVTPWTCPLVLSVTTNPQNANILFDVSCVQFDDIFELGVFPGNETCIWKPKDVDAAKLNQLDFNITCNIKI
eukprot:78708_1